MVIAELLKSCKKKKTRSPEYRKRRNKKRQETRSQEYSARKKVRQWANRSERIRQSITYLGIDGEGQGRKHHKYVLLAVSNEAGDETRWIENFDGLSTRECLDFILALPTSRHKVFAYSFNYDLTKILADVDDETLYKLFRPELRGRKGKFAPLGPKPVSWPPLDPTIDARYQSPYWLNLQGAKFSVSRNGKKVIVWDIFKFFQGKFVAALKDWKVGSAEVVARMSDMKDQRANFDKLNPDEVRAYCLEECQYMAQLAHKLVNAHEAVGLKLRNFYGAGSSAAAMLNVMGIRNQVVPASEAMRKAVASAFFGGRFENSIIGAVHERVWNYDISSAYPYQLYFLPCLLHGYWEKTQRRRDIDQCTAALVRYSLAPNSRIEHWGPFPFRDSNGSISFPAESGGGWVWRDEYLAGERLFPNVKFKEAWVYQCDCTCQPFKRIAEYYNERCRIGKEGPGIVIKLGINSNYGKLAQSLGNAVFQSWIWAGMVTSGCRAQILDALGRHNNRSNLLMVATDGIYSRERLDLRKPLETGTSQTGKPLGGWEEKEVPRGVFVARPGIYFPLQPTKEEIKDIRGRGVGKSVVLENWHMIQHAWEYGIVCGPPVEGYQPNTETVATVANVSRFCGAKSSISRSGKPGAYSYNRADHRDGIKPRYGNWIVRPVELGFQPMPKRASLTSAERWLTSQTGLIPALQLRRFAQDVISTPYSKALKSRETQELEEAMQELIEQPDSDLTEYEEVISE